MSLIRLYASLALPLSAVALLAGPKIEFTTKVFQCGTILEGKSEKLKAEFVVKNAGDEILKLQNVRPGCGCTVVKYDSVVAVGKTAKIQAEVSIKGYRSGKISKGITVTSNASNEQTAHLSIEATIESIIDLSTNSIEFDETKGPTTADIMLYSKKRNLRISDVSMDIDTAGNSTWKSSIPVLINYKWTPADSMRSDGYSAFKLTLTGPAVEKGISGDLVIKTNHPDKPEVKARATIRK